MTNQEIKDYLNYLVDSGLVEFGLVPKEYADIHYMCEIKIYQRLEDGGCELLELMITKKEYNNYISEMRDQKIKELLG